MLYPSTFQLGIPGYRDPVAHPYEVVYQSLERALERTHAPPVRFRPWLQAFQDYAFDRRHFAAWKFARRSPLPIKPAPTDGCCGILGTSTRPTGCHPGLPRRPRWQIGQQRGHGGIGNAAIRGRIYTIDQIGVAGRGAARGSRFTRSQSALTYSCRYRIPRRAASLRSAELAAADSPRKAARVGEFALRTQPS